MSSRSSEASTTGGTLGVTTGGFFIGFRMASKMSLLPSKATMCRQVPRQAVMHALASNEIQMPYFHDLVPRLHCKEPHWRYYYICMVGYSPVDAVQSKIKSPATLVASRRIVKNLGSFSHPPRQGVSIHRHVICMGVIHQHVIGTNVHTSLHHGRSRLEREFADPFGAKVFHKESDSELLCLHHPQQKSITPHSM